MTSLRCGPVSADRASRRFAGTDFAWHRCQVDSVLSADGRRPARLDESIPIADTLVKQRRHQRSGQPSVYFACMHAAWRHATGTLTLERPRILGIVNVTPDSFSDGGRLQSVDDALRLVDRLVSEGADAVDGGGESTRAQGAAPGSEAEELARGLPVIHAVRARHASLPLSVDTVKSGVARAALDVGA